MILDNVHAELNKTDKDQKREHQIVGMDTTQKANIQSLVHMMQKRE